MTNTDWALASLTSGTGTREDLAVILSEIRDRLTAAGITVTQVEPFAPDWLTSKRAASQSAIWFETIDDLTAASHIRGSESVQFSRTGWHDIRVDLADDLWWIINGRPIRNGFRFLAADLRNARRRGHVMTIPFPDLPNAVRILRGES